MKRTSEELVGECKQDDPAPRKRPSSAVAGITKSISACKRCRLKKIKCDQEFPSCRKCARANEPCVSLDPATGRDVPRSYVIFLEDRLTAMMNKLKDCGVDPALVQGQVPATSNDSPCNVQLYEETMRDEHRVPFDNLLAAYLINKGTSMQRGVSSTGSLDEHDRIVHSGSNHPSPDAHFSSDPIKRSIELDESNKNIAALGSMKNNASNSYLGDSSGIPFAKLVFTAVNFKPDSVNEDSDEEIKQREGKYAEYATSESSPDFDPLWLPPRNVANGLISRYFVDSNSQLPVLHREYFLKKYYEPIYGPWDPNKSLASDHTKINTSFKLPVNSYPSGEDGKDVIDGALSADGAEHSETKPWYDTWIALSDQDKQTMELPVSYQFPYFFLNMVFAIGHSIEVLRSDIVNVVTFKRRALQYSRSLYASPDRMEALSGTVLLAIYSLMRPNVPGVWYTMGSALRLTVDLGLHAEKLNRNYDPFTRDLRRRLFWCVYSLDRQICAYFGRPFGIPEENISAKYPSLLDDALITMFNDDIDDYSKVQTSMATSKVVALAMFKVRRIQANIVQVLYAHHGEIPRKYPNLQAWRSAMHDSLDNWFQKEIPKTYRKMNCKFNTEFFNLNYYNTKSMLYGLSPKSLCLDDKSFQVVYENTKGTIDAYYKLCNNGKINYTWVTVHNLFMAGMTYLYVIYYSDKGMNEGQQIAEDYTARLLHVLKELIGTCEAAKNCSKIYKVLSAAVIKLKFDMPECNTTDEAARAPNLRSVTKSQAGVMVASSSNASPVESLKASLSRDPFKIHDIKQELKDTFEVPLDRFFDELEKVTSMSEAESINSHFSSINSPIKAEGQGVHSRSHHPGMVGSKNFVSSKDGQRTVDIISQVTSESIWDEFFGKPGIADSNAAGNNNGGIDSFF